MEREIQEELRSYIKELQAERGNQKNGNELSFFKQVHRTEWLVSEMKCVLVWKKKKKLQDSEF